APGSNTANAETLARYTRRSGVDAPLFGILGCQLFKGERIGSDHMAQRIKEQVGTLAAVEPESHFVQIGFQMLCADLVPASDDSALEQRECGFDRIGMDRADSINTLAVIDDVMVLGSM